MAMVGWSEQRRVLLEVAAELGLCAVSELRPLCAALALMHVGSARQTAFEADVSALGPADQARLRTLVASQPITKPASSWIPVRPASIAYVSTEGAAPIAVGEAAAARAALLALQRMEPLQTEVESSVEVDARAVLDVIFGPRRALSDPTSKTALAPYGIPLPVEELCSSASRAAAEAARIGFPVRISLASPDLRIWDHPDLRVDMVDNAARVRDTFRQLFATAQARLALDPQLAAQAERRLLGVLVTATSEPLALLRVYATPLPRERVAVRIGFADPHGRAARDETITILPAEQPVIERAMRRLAGADLLFKAEVGDAPPPADQVVDVLQRVAAFVNDRRREIEAVELRPLAVLLDGSVEVREACVTVSDWFERNS
jgi:acetyltransferase